MCQALQVDNHLLPSPYMTCHFCFLPICVLRFSGHMLYSCVFALLAFTLANVTARDGHSPRWQCFDPGIKIRVITIGDFYLKIMPNNSKTISNEASPLMIQLNRFISALL